MISPATPDPTFASAARPDVMPPATRLHAVTNLSGYDYLLGLPNDYLTDARRRWPLMLFLHGAGERGSDIWSGARHGPPKLLHDGTALTPAESFASQELAESFVVVAPQCGQLEVWEDEALLGLLDDVSTELSVDASRVYLVGMSMGGFGVWSVGIRNAERFAALVPVCGGGRVADVPVAQRNNRVALEHLGIWAFHGALDRVVPLDESQRMIDAVRRAGVRDVRLTVYPDAAHDSWTETFANAELYAWLLRHRR